MYMDMVSWKLNTVHPIHHTKVTYSGKELVSLRVQAYHCQLILPNTAIRFTDRRQQKENNYSRSSEWLEKASGTSLHLLAGHNKERPIMPQPQCGRCHRAGTGQTTLWRLLAASGAMHWNGASWTMTKTANGWNDPDIVALCTYITVAFMITQFSWPQQYLIPRPHILQSSMLLLVSLDQLLLMKNTMQKKILVVFLPWALTQDRYVSGRPQHSVRPSPAARRGRVLVQTQPIDLHPYTHNNDRIMLASSRVTIINHADHHSLAPSTWLTQGAYKFGKMKFPEFSRLFE